MKELMAYYIGIGFFVGIAVMAYIVRHGMNTSVQECMIITAFWPLYLLGLVQREITLMLLRIIR